MTPRQAHILATIVERFVETAEPISSKILIELFNVSGATLRNEMRVLEDAGYLHQPHTSAGRIPTAKGYQFYIKECMQPSSHEQAIKQKLEKLKRQHGQEDAFQRLYDATALLANLLPNISFLTDPGNGRVYYQGMANVLSQPEFQQNPQMGSNVAHLLEDQLMGLLDGLHFQNGVHYYLGGEQDSGVSTDERSVRILPEVHDCSLMVVKYKVGDKEGAMGMIGPMRMDYGSSTTALKLLSEFLD
jgi:transcriptional regulator of heat shock response